MVHQNERRINSIDDISGKRVGVGLGSSYENYLNKALVLPGGVRPNYPFHDVKVIPGDETITFRNLALGPESGSMPSFQTSRRLKPVSRRPMC